MPALASSIDLSFLSDAMDRALSRRRMVRAANVSFDIEKDKVGGEMSVPQPVTVDVNGTMSSDDYKKCSLIMAVCQNMVQKTLTDSAKKVGVEAATALKNMNAWVQAYADFPLPIFNFVDSQSDTYNKEDFSLSADPDVVESIVNIKGVPDLKSAVIGALKKSGGQIARYKSESRNFNYFGIITAYNDTNIATRVVKFSMDLKQTDVEALCVKSTKTSLHTTYDTYQFAGDKDLMIKLQAKMGDKLVDYISEKLFEFMQSFYDQELKNWTGSLEAVLKKPV